MNLIEKLGIEKCREIVEGAPKGTTDYSNEDNEIIYYQETNNVIFWDAEYSKWDEVYFKVPELKSISDLRTAIAAYDCNPTDNLSHLTDNCTDIRNHLSPLTKVIER